MSRLAEPFLGRWRIDHMDEYDRDYLDLVEPAFIRFDPGGSGEFGFGAVTGQLDRQRLSATYTMSRDTNNSWEA